MNQGAHVRSIAALGELRSAMAVFEEDAGAALSMAEADIVRTIDWIRADRIPHWKKEIMRREELLTRAKSDLARAQMTDHSMGPKSTIDERKAIAKARNQVEEARQKLNASQRWFRELEKQYTLYKGRIAPMQRLTAADMPKARSQLELMARTLDEYLSIQSEESGTPDAASQSDRGLGQAYSGAAATGAAPRKIWKDLAPSRRLRSRAPLADDPLLAMGAEHAADRWSLLSEDAARRLAHLLGYAEALTAQRFDPIEVSRSLGPIAELPAGQDRLLIASGWNAASPTVCIRSSHPPLGDSGWLLVRSDASEPPKALVAVRVELATEVFPELAILTAVPRGVAILINGGELIAIQDERGRPLSGFDSDTLDSDDGSDRQGEA